MSTNQIDHVAIHGVAAVSPMPIISAEVRAAAERLGVGRYFDEVVAFTVEIFGSFPNIELEPDPEVPDWEHIIFSVPVTGSVGELVEKDMQWVRRLHATIPRAPRVFTFVMDYHE